MEGGLDRGFPAFAEFVKGMQEARAAEQVAVLHFTHPLVVKTPKIAPDPAQAIDNISRQLNLGVSGDRVRRRRERGRSASGSRGDAVQVEGRHAAQTTWGARPRIGG